MKADCPIELRGGCHSADAPPGTAKPELSLATFSYSAKEHQQLTIHLYGVAVRYRITPAEVSMTIIKALNEFQTVSQESLR